MKSATRTRNFNSAAGERSAQLQREWTPCVVRLKAIIYVEKKERIVLRKDEANAVLRAPMCRRSFCGRGIRPNFRIVSVSNLTVNITDGKFIALMFAARDKSI
jgi:hypothetical protein